MKTILYIPTVSVALLSSMRTFIKFKNFGCICNLPYVEDWLKTSTKKEFYYC